MDTRLLELLVCPVCKGPLEHDRDAHELICRADHLAYPVRDGIPVMLESEARDLSAPPPTPGSATAAGGDAPLSGPPASPAPEAGR